MDSWIHLLTKKFQHTVFRVCLQIRQRACISYYHGGNTIGTTCVVDRDDTAYMVVDREFRLPTE